MYEILAHVHILQLLTIVLNLSWGVGEVGNLGVILVRMCGP